ncbi:unnamed protein product [Rotaria sp. Silwood2]|nr:unnamed protein product [Rotaria sp. Silwood2]
MHYLVVIRIPGKQSSIKELRDMYDRGLSIELNNSYSPATISSLLKIYLQSLPEPIIPVKNFDEFFEIGSCFKYNQTNDIDRLKKLIEKTLSSTNYALLAYLCLFLKKLTEHAQETKMDTDNLAVTFGNNLIRTSEELDLNMIKGHSYNLLPLIKVFIDHSEYLFPTNSNELCQRHNESIAKSSGFSSFSSLLSSNEQPIKIHPRSSSMPSIYCTRFSSFDSSNLSYSDQSDTNNVHCHSKLLLKKRTSDTSEQLDSQQSFTTCFEAEFSIDQENNEKNQINVVQNRFSDIDVIKDEPRTQQRAAILEQKHRSYIPSSQLLSTSNISSPARKISKKNFANKVGKSLSNFKSNVSKAFNPHFSSTETIQYSNTMDASSHRTICQNDKRNTFDSNLLTDCLKSLQNENHILKELIDKKEASFMNLTKTSYEERLKYEREISQLKQTIDELRLENSQLKAHYQSSS